MERRFLFTEQSDPGIMMTGTITEYELKRRICTIAEMFNKGEGTVYFNKVVDILLHGEKEQSLEELLKNECAAHNKKRPCPICEPSKQPDGGTPGDPWEEWVRRMPMVADFGPHKALQDWFRKMPR